jgi:hypothetical protein
MGHANVDTVPTRTHRSLKRVTDETGKIFSAQSPEYAAGRGCAVSKGRSEDKALHFEVRNPRVGPRRMRVTMLGAPRISTVIHGNTEVLKGRVVRPAAAGIALCNGYAATRS